LIIEFIGPSSAGKTTLALGVARRLRADGRRVRDHSSPSSSLFITIGYAVQTPFMLAPILSDWPAAGPSLRLASRRVRLGAGNAFWRAARFYALVRRVGEHSLRRRNDNSICIVDEGLMGSLDLALAGPPYPSRAEVEDFVAALPLPDVLVSVDAPLKTLVERTLARPDPPRHIHRFSEQQIRDRLASLQSVFGGLDQIPRCSARIIKAWNPAGSIGDREREMDRVADTIRVRLRER
jgi:thymidylate kinase